RSDTIVCQRGRKRPFCRHPIALTEKATARSPSHLGKFGNFARNCERLRVGAPLASRESFHFVFQEAFMDVDVVTRRVQAEFEEMPGMTLTMPQASRLFGIEREICKMIVERLVRTSYLKWTAAGSFTRAA